MFDESFWVACSFVGFISLIFKPAKSTIIKTLDTRIERIKAELEEAEKLRKEAEEVLKSYQKMQLQVLSETKEIIDQAEKRVSFMIESAEVELDKSIERRRIASLQKIASYEAEILKNLRDQAVHIAISVVQKMLKERLASKAADPQFIEALAEANKKLH